MTFNLFAHTRGLVVAPAGCGKTQAIVDALRAHDGPPVLVLTHTNAGVGALRDRLKAASVPISRFRLATLDGWCLRMVAAFPALSGLMLDRSRAVDYPALRRAAFQLLTGDALDGPLRATYSRLVIDEHQDCSCDQHAVVVALAARLPTIVLGDPLQRIFDFRVGDLPDWDSVVAVDFPVVATFNTPWRWNNAGEPAFGQWVLDARNDLLGGRHLDLSVAPPNIRWVQKGPDATAIAQVQRNTVAALRPAAGEGLLVIGDAKNRDARSRFARGAAGMTVVEPVDLNEMIAAAAQIDAATGLTRLAKVLSFARETMTGVDTEAIAKRLESLTSGKARTEPTACETACLACTDDDSFTAMATVLEALPMAGRRVFRRQMHSAMVEALRRAALRKIDLYDAAVSVREQHRAAGRQMPKRAVGSTLLLKGLEADHAVILDADEMNARHLYVALSRASRSLTIISASQTLSPRR